VTAEELLTLLREPVVREAVCDILVEAMRRGRVPELTRELSRQFSGGVSMRQHFAHGGR
jgi:hypothetical protein